MPRPRPIVSTALVLVLAGGGPAGAQSTRPGPPPAADRPAPPEAPLAGPTVEPAAREDDGGRRRDRPRRTNPRAFFRVVRTLELAPAQRRAIAAIGRELQDVRRVFQRAHGEEMAEVRRAVRAHREAGRRVPAELQTRVAALEALAPDAAAYQTRIWAILDDDQRERLRRELDRPRTDRATRAAAVERRIRRLRALLARRPAGEPDGPTSRPSSDRD